MSEFESCAPLALYSNDASDAAFRSGFCSRSVSAVVRLGANAKIRKPVIKRAAVSMIDNHVSRALGDEPMSQDIELPATGDHVAKLNRVVPSPAKDAWGGIEHETARWSKVISSRFPNVCIEQDRCAACDYVDDIGRERDSHSINPDLQIRLLRLDVVADGVLSTDWRVGLGNNPFDEFVGAVINSSTGGDRLYQSRLASQSQ